MRASALLVALMCLTPLVVAAPQPTDFAQGFDLKTQPGAAVHRVELTEPVYHHITRSDLGDLVVFNAAGEAVPQAFAEPEPVPEAPATETPLAFFTLSAEALADPTSELEVKLDAGGTVVAVNTTRIPREHVRAWLVDTGAQTPRVRSLRLEWNTGSAGFVHLVDVKSSSDLRHWQDVAQVALAELQQDGHALRRDSIDVPAGSARFLRIDWPGPNPPEVTSILGRTPAPGDATPRGQSRLAGEPAAAPESGWIFEMPGPMRVDRLAVVLPGTNNFAELRAWSRTGPEQAWTDRGRILVWRVNTGGLTLDSEPARVHPSRDRYWRIESASGDAHALGPAPALLAGWRPDALLFVARGSEPFVLGVGSANAVAAPQAVGALLQTLPADAGAELLRPAFVADTHTLGGDAALRPRAAPIPWQRLLLWALLVTGVLVMLRMAIGLLRQGGQRPQV